MLDTITPTVTFVNKTQGTVGLLETSTSLKNDKTGSVFIGLRTRPSTAIQNSTEVQVKYAEIMGATAKVSGNFGVLKYGLTGSLAGSYDPSTSNKAVQLSFWRHYWHQRL